MDFALVIAIVIGIAMNLYMVFAPYEELGSRGRAWGGSYFFRYPNLVWILYVSSYGIPISVWILKRWIKKNERARR